MKYLQSAAAVAALALLSLVSANDNMFKGVAFNEEVIRKYKLDQNSIEEVNIDIKFKPLTNQGETHYFHVVPHDFESHLVEIKAELTLGAEPLKINKVDKLPAELQKVANEAGATDVSFYEITIPDQEYSTSFVAFSIREIYKKRRQPFPSTIRIREDMMVRFTDSKYFLSVYPTKTQKLQL